MSESVVLDYEIKTSIDKVWSALTDSDTLTKWMMFKTNTFKPEVGHQFQFSGVEGYDSTIQCKVTEVSEPNKLAYTWETEGQSGGTHSTVVTWTLTSKSENVTQLNLVQSGFDPEARQELGGAKYGWQHMLGELETLLVEG